MRIYLIRHGRQESPLCNVDVALAPREEGGRPGFLERDWQRRGRLEKSGPAVCGTRAVETAEAY